MSYSSAILKVPPTLFDMTGIGNVCVKLMTAVVLMFIFSLYFFHFLTKRCIYHMHTAKSPVC